MTEKRIKELIMLAKKCPMENVSMTKPGMLEVLQLAAVALRYRRLAAQRQKKVDQKKIKARR